MRVIFTGVPGTGKTLLARALAEKLNFELVEINELVKRKKLFTRTERDGTKIVDLKKLERELKKLLEQKENLVIEGHLACELKLNVDIVIITRTNPETLEKRLKKRGYRKEKIDENVLAELLDYCVISSEQNLKGAKLYEIETSKSEKENLREIMDIIFGRGERFRAGWVDWSKELSARA